jgi:hypothetical protein
MDLSECQWFYDQLRRQSWPIVVVGATRYVLGIIPGPGPDLVETIVNPGLILHVSSCFLLIREVKSALSEEAGLPFFFKSNTMSMVKADEAYVRNGNSLPFSKYMDTQK